MKSRSIDFDLLYLGLLTKKQVKPLSRWEKGFGPHEIRFLKSIGLKTRPLERYLESGQQVKELVFSANQEPIEAYANAFDRKPLGNSVETAVSEGRLFGYPGCCVRSFTSHGYLPNGLKKEDQEILFHWACPDCVVTAELLPRYRAIYEEVKRTQLELYGRDSSVRQVAALTPSLGLALCLLLAGCGHKSTSHESTSPKPETDVHWIALEKDADQDYLKDEWEGHFGLNPSERDTDRDGVFDGPQLAKRTWEIIQDPPPWIDCLEALADKMQGVHTCPKCGQMVDMGFVEIRNTNKNTSIRVGFLALHFMEHGSFAYQAQGGSEGVINPVQLDSILSE